MEKNGPEKGEKLQCPYDKNHWVHEKRMQVHLIKCEKQHPNVKLRKCPYNYAHHMKEDEYLEHTKNCVDRHLVVFDDFETAAESAPNSQPPSTSGARVDPEESFKPMAAALGEENWDDMDEAPYNPLKHCMENKIIRKPRLMTKTERIEFYRQEAIRHAKLEKEKKSKKESAKTHCSP